RRVPTQPGVEPVLALVDLRHGEIEGVEVGVDQRELPLHRHLRPSFRARRHARSLLPCIDTSSWCGGGRPAGARVEPAAQTGSAMCKVMRPSTCPPAELQRTWMRSLGQITTVAGISTVSLERVVVSDTR